MSAPGITYDYKLGVKREVIDALRDALKAWPDDRLGAHISIVNEWPSTEIEYPMIVFKFIERSIRNIGIGHLEVGTSNDGAPFHLKHWYFEGALQFKIYARDPLERDTISAGLVSLIAFGEEVPEFKQFYDDIYDDDFVAIQLISDVIQPGGDAVESPAWGSTADDHIFTSSYSINVVGEFVTSPRTGGLVILSHAVVYPYKTGQVIPQGSQAFDSEHDDRTVPWTP